MAEAQARDDDEDPELELPPLLGPVLVLLPDPEARVDLGAPLLGHAPSRRMAEAALASGFRRVLATPGLRHRPEQASEVSAGDSVGVAALVVFEGTFVDPQLMRLMVEHPLEADEHFSLYDGIGRPAAWFTGELRAVPAIMPLTEELEYPEGMGPRDIARVVYEEDVSRAEWLVLRERGVVTEGERSRWLSEVVVPTLRRLVRSRLSLAQLELVALAVALSAAPLALVDSWPALVLASSLLLVGVHVSRLLQAAARLRGEATPPAAATWVPGETLARATRPLAHAVLAGTLTYVLVAEPDRSQIAGLVLLAVGAGGVFLSLAHARSVLRGRETATLALPDGWSFFAQIGMRLPSFLEGAPLLEIAVLVVALTGVPALPWALLVGTAVARLWRWFTSPPPAALDRIASE